MNAISVTAHGEPNPFVRRVQYEPQIAVSLLQLAELQNAIDLYDDTGDLPMRNNLAAVARSAGFDADFFLMGRLRRWVRDQRHKLIKDCRHIIEGKDMSEVPFPDWRVP